MRLIVSASLLAFVALFTTVSFAVENQNCKAFPSPISGGFCIYPGTNADIAYYLHGRNGSETRWQEDNFYSEQIREYWRDNGRSYPTVITVSFGKLWILNAQQLQDFETKIVPMIEAGIGGLKGRRMVFGESMGGVNSIQLTFRTGLFSRAGIMCPQIFVGLTPWATAAEIDAYVKGSRAYGVLGRGGLKEMKSNMAFMGLASRSIYPTPADWDAADPLKLASAADPQVKPLDIYLSAGLFDEYVLYEGNVEFQKVLKSRGYSVEWRPLYGGHCVVDVASIAEFLVKP